MAINKQRKDKLVASYEELLQRSGAVFFAEYSRMTVKEMESLRREIYKVNGVMHVTKNTLLNIALEKTGQHAPASMLAGQLSTGFALGDIPPLAQVLIDFAKKNQAFTLKGGLVNGRTITADQIEALAKLPSLEQLRGQLLGLISAPARQLASTVAGGVRQLVNVLDAYAKKDTATSEPAEASA